MSTSKYRLIAVAEALRTAASRGRGEVFGSVRPSEHLIQVLSAESGAGMVAVGTIERAERGPDGVTLTAGGESFAFLPAAGVPTPASVEVVRLSDELDSRRAGILGAQALAAARVVLIGTGSVGSAIGQELAKAGVKWFRPVDRDRLDASNLSRHACGLRDLGRRKAVAVAEALQDRGAAAEAVVADLAEADEATWDHLVAGANLVVASTDAPSLQFLANEACLRNRVPGLFVGAFERACGGEIFVLRPGAGPCLFCMTGFRSELGDAVAPVERRQAYQAADANQLHAEPGLGVDITYLSAVAAMHALALLVPEGSRHALVDPAHPFVLVHGGSEPQGSFAELFVRPFEVVRGRPRRDEPCPVCGWTSLPAEEVAP